MAIFVVLSSLHTYVAFMVCSIAACVKFFVHDKGELLISIGPFIIVICDVIILEDSSHLSKFTIKISIVSIIDISIGFCVLL